MKTILFIIPLKSGSLEQYKAFAKETVKRSYEYKDMLKRYDIHSAKIWHKQMNGRDYVFVYHDVGENFAEKMKGWDSSEHPFDQWFRSNMAKSYDIKNASDMENPEKIIEFIA